MQKNYLSLFGLCLIFPLVSLQTDEVFVQNLDSNCMRCLCIATTNCDLTFGCEGGYCGPFKISRVYWVDAGKIVMDEDDPKRDRAYQDCALNLYCARKIVRNYLRKFARDCNGDGVTNCLDYLMINFNGGYQCTPKLERNKFGKDWLQRFLPCIRNFLH